MYGVRAKSKGNCGQSPHVPTQWISRQSTASGEATGLAGWARADLAVNATAAAPEVASSRRRLMVVFEVDMGTPFRLLDSGG